MKPDGNILILCAKNSARSQMAEALIRKHCGARCGVYSAGLEASEIQGWRHSAKFATALNNGSLSGFVTPTSGSSEPANE